MKSLKIRLEQESPYDTPWPVLKGLVKLIRSVPCPFALEYKNISRFMSFDPTPA